MFPPDGNMQPSVGTRWRDTSMSEKRRDESSRRKHRTRTSEQDVYRAACSYVAAGLSLLPIYADGSKMPAIDLLPWVWSDSEQRWRRPWGPYKDRAPTLSEIRDWFRDSAPNQDYGLAIIGGAVSGGLEIIDLDNAEVAKRWSRLVKERAPGLLERLVRVRTPRPGMHAYFRSDVYGGNQKLARVPDPAKDKANPKTIIEVKGEAGYCLAPPSPAACHPTGRCYTFIGDRDLTEIPTISIRERDILFECARELNQWIEPARPTYSPPRRPAIGRRFARPGDDFNARADWAEILEPHGWRWLRRCGNETDQWCRPGKSRGLSATTNHQNSDVLFVFSSNADPFEEGKGYSKFHAYALLNHYGDFSAAARALARRGYGSGGREARKHYPDPYARYAGYTRRTP